MKIAIMERKLFMLKYGYISEQEPLSNHIKYNTKTKDYFHPWSGKVLGQTFGVREYSKFLPLKDYLELPVDLIEDILEGIVVGEKDAIKAKLEAAKREASKQGGSTDPQKAAMALAQKDKR